MKILIVNRFLCPRGGIETYIKRLGDHYRLLGHEVAYFGEDSENRWVGNPFDIYISPKRRHGFFSGIRSFFSTIYSVEARKRMHELIFVFEPDVIHLNNFDHSLTPSILCEVANWRKTQNRECVIISTAHGYDLVCPIHTCFNTRLQVTCEKCLDGNCFHCVRENCLIAPKRRLLAYALSFFIWNRIIHIFRELDLIICCSSFLKSKIDKSKDLCSKTISFHNFVDKVAIPDVKKEDYVLYFGRLVPEKGIRTLVSVCKELPQIRFVFAGAGELSSELAGVKNAVFVGFKNGDELQELIAKAAFSICPSECYENCPFSVLESIMLGTPVIGANIGGIPELIADGQYGLLFRSGDAEDLRASIERLYYDKSLQKMLSDNCLRCDFDTIDSYADKLLESILVSKRERGRRIEQG